MTPAIQALRQALGLPLLSESKAREAVIAVLESVREPSANVTVRGWNHVNERLENGDQSEMNKLYVTFIDALISEQREP